MAPVPRHERIYYCCRDGSIYRADRQGYILFIIRGGSKMKNWLLARLREPSTYAGIAVFMSQVTAAATGNPVAIGAVIASVGAVVQSEQAAVKEATKE